MLAEISRVARSQVERQYWIYNELLLPALAEHGVRFRHRDEWTRTRVNQRLFRTRDRPVLSPIGLDPLQPFPRLVNWSLNFIVQLEGGLAILPVPRSLPQIVALPRRLAKDGISEYVFLSSIIHAIAGQAFPGMRVHACHPFRLTCCNIVSLDPEEAADLASALRSEPLAPAFFTA